LRRGKVLNLEKVRKFSEILGKLKENKRSGWNSRLQMKNPESIADHSYRAAMLAMCLGDLMEVDAERLIRMLLLHDIQEAITGDYDYRAKKKIGITEVKRQEANAIRQVLSLLPKKLQRNYLSIWKDFENQNTQEAILANDIDKLEMIMQALEYEKKGYSPKKFDVFWDYGKKTIKTPLIQELFQLLVNERKQRSMRIKDRNHFK